MRRSIAPQRMGLVLCAALAAWMLLGWHAAAGFVYETPAEFLTSADVNGDGLLDVLVIDRLTGNVRVGYQDGTGALTWSTPIPTGVANVEGLATGRYLAADREALALTTPGFNRVRIVNLTDTNTATSPFTFAPNGIGPSMLIGLAAPAGISGDRDVIWVSSTEHSPGSTFVETFTFTSGHVVAYRPAGYESAYLESGNSLLFGDTQATYAAAVARGATDTFLAHSVTNGVVAFLARSNLPPGTEYVFGRCNNETYPRFLFYVPGESNITVQSLTTAPGTLSFGLPTVNTFAAAVQRVFYVDEGTNGLVLIEFADLVIGARLPPGSDTLQEQYRFSGTATGVLPLGSDRFALLTRAANGTSTDTAQVYTKSDGNYTQTGSASLPPSTTSRTRANVWLFSTEPFVNTSPLFVSSVNGGDWTDSATGIPGSLTVIAETDRGISSGLGNPVTQTLAAPPGTAQFGIVNQYHPGISLFTYSGVRAPEPVLVAISPPPGNYETGINVSFTTSNGSDVVFYRVGSAGLFQQFAAPLPLSSNAAVEYFGRASSGERSSIQIASYTFTDNALPPLVTTNGIGTNNIPPPPPASTNSVPAYAYGTIVYSRITGTNGAIWMVNLDGSADRYITEGTRPRLSPDGRFLAFLREGYPYAVPESNNGNIWVRDLLTGGEQRLITHTSLISGFDWDYHTNLVFDHGCGLFITDLAGNIRQLSAGTDCNDDAPMVNPVDGTLTFHNASGLANANSGLFVTDASLSTKIPVSGAARPHWPSWAPDGWHLAYANYNYTNTSIPQGGMDLYVTTVDGTRPNQITAFADGSGFRFGALWSPAGDALIGAGRMLGTNGIWVLPLSEDITRCEGTPWMIPITPGADLGVDFVGSIFIPPAPPRVSIRRESGSATVFWRHTAWPYVLETTSDLGPSASWTPIAPPYGLTGGNHEVAVPLPGDAARYFRLRLP